MFTNNYNKSTFGTPSTSSAFGFGNTAATNTTPFGQTQQFGKATAAPAFGSNAPLFGNAPQPNTAPLFSNTAFGATQSSGFGTGLFGQQQAPGANALFSNSPVQSFGQQNKASAFGFGSPATSTLFGQQQPQTFQTQNTSGVFGSTPSFGVMGGAQIGTQMGTVTKFNPVTGTDTMQKSGITHSINTKHHCITCMKDYENKSFEELRWEDYQCNRKGPQQQSSFGSSPFGAPATSAPLFGQTENKSAFAQPSTSFGTAPAPFGAQQSLFGKTTGAFGTTPTTNTFGFNSNTSFGVNNPVKSFATPTSQNVFSTPATQQSAFGANLFAPTNAQPNAGGIFGAKTSSFGTQPVFTFGQTNSFQTPKTTSAFGSNFPLPVLPANTGFAQPSNVFSQVQNNPFTNLQKPATQPVFGQPQQPGFMGTQPVNNSYFGNSNKPLFTNTTGSYFGNNSGFMLPQQQPVAPTHLIGLESQQQMPDFNKTVEQIYDFFPRQNFLLDLSTTHDTTNPIDIKDILETESPLTMTIESRLRIVPKSTNFVSSINYQKQILLGDLSDKENISSVISKSGRRLNLRKSTTRKSNETSIDCSLSILNNSKSTDISQLAEANRANMFRNIQTLQDSLGQNIKLSPFAGNEAYDTSPYFKRQSPSKFKILDLPSDTTCEEEYLQEISVLSHHVKTINQSPPQRIPEDLLKRFDQMESPLTKPQEESFQGTPDTFKKGSHKVVSLSQTIITDLSKKLSSPETPTSDIVSPEGGSILSKGGKPKSGKTVRFIDDDNDADDFSTPSRSIYTTRSRTDERDVVDFANNTEVPHPCGIKLTRQEYYTLPPYQELGKYKDENGTCLIRGFTIGRTGYGNIYFPDQIDISNMDLDEIIHFRYREVQVYPNEEGKPPEGEGLNRSAQVTLDHIWPKGHQPGKSKTLDADAITHLIDRLCILSEKQNAKFLDYRPETGSWVFFVDHFSKYTYCEEDDEVYPAAKSDSSHSRREYIVDESALFQNKDATTDYVKHDLGGNHFKDGGLEKTSLSPIPNRLKNMGGKLHSLMDFSDDNPLEKLKHNNYIRAMNSTEQIHIDKHQTDVVNRVLDDEPLVKCGIKYMHMIKDLEEIKQLDEQSRLNDLQQLEDMDHFDSIDHLNGMNNLVLSQMVDEALYEEDFLSSKLMNENQKDISDSVLLRNSMGEDDSLSDESSSEMEMPSFVFPSNTTSSFLFSKKKEQPFCETALIPVLDETEYFLANHFGTDVPYSKSLLTTRNFKDIAIYKGRAFRVGWGEGFTTMLMSQTMQDEDVVSYSVNLKDKMISKVKFDSLHNSFSQINLEEHLKIVCEESIVSIDDAGIPLFTIKKGCRSIMRHNYTSEIFDKESNNGIMSYFTEVWGLCLAFWGPNASTATERLELFIKWLDNTTISYMKSDLDTKNPEKSVVFKNVFAYLSAHQIEEAAQLAIDRNLPALALLISQCSSSESAKQLMHAQLQEWKSNGVTEHMDKTLMKIYMLLAGVSVMSDVNVCENLDWKRALGIHVWYMISPGTSLVSGIQNYCKAFSELHYARKPVPKHCDLDSNVTDMQYHIMLLFQNIVTGLNVVLNPITYTDNAIDYRLSWLLLQALDALNVGSISEESSNYIHISFSSQLEDLGMWKWAIFVLLFVKDSNIKRDAIMGILYRNISVDRTDEANLEIEDTLVKEFNISAAWLHTVLANKSEMVDAPLETYKHLTLLGDWAKAHEVAMLQVIPKLITSGQIEELLNMLRYLIPGSNQILTWGEDVGLIVEFLEVRHRLIQRRNEVTEFELQEVGSQLMKLCSQVKKIQTTTIFQSLAIAEIARFISELLMILFKEIEPRKLNSLPDISLKLQALIMPPDFKHKDLLRYFDNYVSVDET